MSITEENPRKKKSGWWRPVLLLSVVIAIFILAGILGVGEKLAQLRGWIASLGAWGPAVYVLFYAAFTVAALPGSAITVLAGALFGSVLGVIVVSIASTLGASLAFLVSRYFARQAMENWLEKSEKFQRLDSLTEEHGAIIVAFTRLVPLFPFNILNYGFGLTKVRFWTYVFWSWLCMLPGTVLYVVGTDALVKGISEGEVPWMLIGVLIAAAVIVFFLVRFARSRLEHAPDKSTAMHP